MLIVRRTQLQLPEELLERVDAHSQRTGRSRSELVREAIERYLVADREAGIDQVIVDAYTRQPPAGAWDEQAAKLLIAAEPW